MIVQERRVLGKGVGTGAGWVGANGSIRAQGCDAVKQLDEHEPKKEGRFVALGLKVKKRRQETDNVAHVNSQLLCKRGTLLRQKRSRGGKGRCAL